jgi:hypothetical protein
MSPVQCVTDVPVHSSLRRLGFLALRESARDCVALLLLHLGVGVAGGKGPQRGYRKTAVLVGWRQGETPLPKTTALMTVTNEPSCT